MAWECLAAHRRSPAAVPFPSTSPPMVFHPPRRPSFSLGYAAHRFPSAMPPIVFPRSGAAASIAPPPSISLAMPRRLQRRPRPSPFFLCFSVARRRGAKYRADVAHHASAAVSIRGRSGSRSPLAQRRYRLPFGQARGHVRCSRWVPKSLPRFEFDRPRASYCSERVCNHQRSLETCKWNQQPGLARLPRRRTAR